MWRWDSEAFGNTQANQDPGNTGNQFVYNLRFPGQYYDAESGRHYNYFRDYDPSTGRYVQSDPIGLAGGSFSTYGYVDGSPLLHLDEFGLAGNKFKLIDPMDPGGKEIEVGISIEYGETTEQFIALPVIIILKGQSDWEGRAKALVLLLSQHL
ncbi:RHS repeat-associated core domain-containing protein [Andreprevotia sp. IGB-42]|uniref:RHS repeat-associated core domain-containing protein n=1 Tax=Andreprevotia sp. IGB-42 TaxID=2497473 RepID=UPI001F1E1E27|nr:RHS repeat-associated core domain-containing protein [Andreprevotia sp. IGB-42]